MGAVTAEIDTRTAGGWLFSQTLADCSDVLYTRAVVQFGCQLGDIG